jgi:hypothetical protein
VVFQGLKELGYSGVNHHSKSQGNVYNVNKNLNFDTAHIDGSKLKELQLNMDLYELSDETLDYNLFNNKLVIIDEVHELWNQNRAADGIKGDGAVTYPNVQRAIRVSKSAKVIGLTATPFHKFRKESYQEELYRAKYKNDPTFMERENADPYRLLYRLIGDVKREHPVHGYVSYYYGYPSGRENKYAIPGVYDPSFPIVLSLPLYGKALASQSTFKNLEAFYRKSEMMSDHKNSFSLRIHSIASFLRDVYQWEHTLDNGSGERRSKTLVLARDGEIKILKKLLTQSLGVGPIDKNNPMTPGRSKWAVLENPEQMTAVQKANTTKLERTINGPDNAWGERITVVLAPMAQYSTGHDFKAFDALILTHVPTTGYTTLKQAIGRVTRLCAHRNLRPDIQPSVHKMIRVYMFASVDVGEWKLPSIPDTPDQFNHSLEWKEVVRLVREREAYTSDHSRLEDISVHKTLLGPNMQRREPGLLKVWSMHPYFMLGGSFMSDWKESNISANHQLEQVNRDWNRFTFSKPEKSFTKILNAS